MEIEVKKLKEQIDELMKENHIQKKEIDLRNERLSDF